LQKCIGKILSCAVAKKFLTTTRFRSHSLS
jgi:hypothetical protein